MIFTEKKIVNSSSERLGKKNFHGLFEKIPHYVTFKCSYCLLKGKPIDVGNRFGLQEGLLKDKLNHSLITKNTWKSYKEVRDPYSRLDALSLAFIYRGYSAEINAISEFGTKDCLTTSSRGWKLLMSLGQDEPINTFNYQYTRHFLKEACYAGRVESIIKAFDPIFVLELKQFFNVI